MRGRYNPSDETIFPLPEFRLRLLRCVGPDPFTQGTRQGCNVVAKIMGRGVGTFPGDNDFVIDASHSRRLHYALQTLGIPSVYVEYPDTVHAFDQYFGVSRRVAPAAQMATNDIEQFLALMV